MARAEPKVIGGVLLVLLTGGCAAAAPPGELDLTGGGDLSSADLAQRPADLSLPIDLGPHDGGPGDLGGTVCAAETYDVNANSADGCEVTDAPLGNHLQTTNVYVGSFSCDDSSSAQNLTGIVPADARAHSPQVSGFDVASGSAPDWFRIHASGGLCVNDLNLHLQVTGSATPSCYHLSAQASSGLYTCQTAATGGCDISNGSGSYSDGSDIFVEVSKTCAGNDKATYTITGHL